MWLDGFKKGRVRTTRRQHWRCSKELQIPWERWGGRKEVSHSQIAQLIRQVLKSQLKGKKKVRAINTYSLPVIRHPAGIISWAKLGHRGHCYHGKGAPHNAWRVSSHVHHPVIYSGAREAKDWEMSEPLSRMFFFNVSNAHRLKLGIWSTRKDIDSLKEFLRNDSKTEVESWWVVRSRKYWLSPVWGA